MRFSRLRVGRSVIVVGLAFAVACGGSGGQASPSATTAAPVVTSTALASQAPVSPSPQPAAAKDACALVSPSDMQAAFGPLKAGTTPTLEQAAAAAMPPGALSASVCSYRFQDGDISVLLGKFQDSTGASAGLKSLIVMAQAQASGGSFRTLPGLGDEATIYTVAIPAPIAGQGAGLLVRKGAVDFVLSGGFSQGHGPADLGQAFEAVARKAAATI